MPVHATDRGWILETNRTAYALGLNATGLLVHRYWGARLPYVEDYPEALVPFERSSFDTSLHLTPEEYPGSGGLRYTDPCLKVSFADGVRDVDLIYQSYTRAGDDLTLTLQDRVYPLVVRLHYRIHPACDLIERRVTLENRGDTPIRVERVFSARWMLPEGDGYHLSHLYGRHIDEYRLVREALTPGIKSIESRRLTTSHHHAPWFALDKNAGEDSGEVWFGTLAWSGNWKISAEVTEFASTRINIGWNDWDFAWELKPGAALATPPALAGYTQGGFGSASRALHDHVRDTLVPHGHTLHKVLYNSWEATTFNVDEASQSALAEKAARLGVELFVMDDGWFHGRDSDNAGLGDWWPDEVKFPHGLGGLIKTVNDLGMAFGLWVEPEMVNPDSDLYRAHPDWAIHFPTRPRSQARNQLILNFARADVQEYILQVMDDLLRQHNIAFIKWDMNRSVSEPGWQDAPGDPRELWVRYVHGLYHVWGTLRQRFPAVVWQSCSGGGGRADLGILRLADQVWVSDNTEAAARLEIQDGYSRFLPASAMEAWVTDWGEHLVPLEFRFHVSMCGSLGIGANLNHWSQADNDLAARCIRLYKEIRPVVQLGDQYRLDLPHPAFRAVEYVAKDRSEAVLFAFRVFSRDPVNFPLIRLRGLELEALYHVEGRPAVRSGRAWMEAGLKVELGNLQSRVLRLRRVGPEL